MARHVCTQTAVLRIHGHCHSAIGTVVVDPPVIVPVTHTWRVRPAGQREITLARRAQETAVEKQLVTRSQTMRRWKLHVIDDQLAHAGPINLALMSVRANVCGRVNHRMRSPPSCRTVYPSPMWVPSSHGVPPRLISRTASTVLAMPLVNGPAAPRARTTAFM